MAHGRDLLNLGCTAAGFLPADKARIHFICRSEQMVAAPGRVMGEEGGKMH